MERFVENGYTTSRYDFRGNLLSMTEQQPKSASAGGDPEEKD